jgi:excisionase family DNA binding protein
VGVVNGAWPGLLSREEACKFLACGEQKLRELICDRSIKTVSLPGGKQLLFRLTDLEKFVASLEEIDSSKRIRERQKMTDSARRARAEKAKSTVVKQVEHGVAEGSTVGAVG